MTKYLRYLIALALVAGWAAVPYLLPGRLSIFVTILIYAPIVIGLSMLAGYAGQASLGQAAFFGTGAYVNGVLVSQYGANPWMAGIVAIAASGLLAYIVGGPVLMLRGHYLVIATLGFNIIVEVFAKQLRGLTGGNSGLPGITSLELGAYEGDVFYYYAAGLLTIAAVLLSRNLIQSRFGRALQAIETSETAAATLSIRSAHYKNLVFVWSALLAGAAGVLYSGWVSFISPSTFGLSFSVVLLTMAVVGGIASIPGALLGTALLELLREELKNAPGWLGGGSPESEIVVFGVLLVLIVMFAPEGLWPKLSKLVPALPPTGGERSSEPGELVFDRGDESSAVLTTGGLTRRFGGLIAVKNVDLEAGPGRILAVIGPNGAGKTTLLNLMSGVLTPTAGHIGVAGRSVAGTPAHRIASRGVARSWQTPRLFSLLNVLNNVKVGVHRRGRAGLVRCALTLARSEEQRIEAQALAALDLVGILDKADNRVTSLSFGAQRLVELARALASGPRLLLLDEPASGLTTAERDQLVALIKRVRSEGVAVVLVEHNVDLVMNLADEILVLHHGEVLARGTPNEIKANPSVIAAYLGEAGDRTPAAPVARSGDPLLSVERLNSGYGPIRVLHDVSMQVHNGEVVAVLGRNGAGKTTLMKAITGFIKCKGRVRLNEVVITGRAPEVVTALGLSLVPERRQLLESMTVRDHLELGAYPRRKSASRAGIFADIDRCYELFPILREKEREIARSLSGGQQQMLAIARALMARPKMLLLDEPLLGLAPRVVEDILDTITQLRGEGIGVVVVEQNVGAVLPVVDRAYVLENGRVVLSDTAAMLMGSTELEAAFLGRDLSGGNGVQPGIAASERKEG
jgi:ABC-type branched-subunit amino acid transport system ATPase component/ABC-type branched-subunit amino acid transport system permease subunit